MLKRISLAIIIFIFLFPLSGCYRIRTIDSLRQTYQKQEWNGEPEIKNVILIGKVKESLKFPVKRYLLSSGNEYIWVLVHEEKALPEDNTKIIAIGVVKRFLLVGDICIEEKARHSFVKALILFSLSAIAISILIIWVIIMLNKKHYLHF